MIAIMETLRFIISWAVVALLAACAGGPKQANDSSSKKNCRMEMPVGSRIPVEVCTTEEEEAMRKASGDKKFNRSIHRPGSVKPGSTKPGGW